ncbi:MAG: response regulator [Bacteroidia bacterium]
MKRYKNILLIDDNVDDQVLFLEALKNLNQGFQCTIADSSPQGLTKLLAYQTPDLIFLDINLPAMDGFEFIKHLKKDENYNHIPVIIYSGSNDKNVVMKSKKAGASVFLSKPFKLEDLVYNLGVILNLDFESENFVFDFFTS